VIPQPILQPSAAFAKGFCSFIHRVHSGHAANSAASALGNCRTIKSSGIGVLPAILFHEEREAMIFAAVFALAAPNSGPSCLVFVGSVSPYDLAVLRNPAGADAVDGDVAFSQSQDDLVALGLSAPVNGSRRMTIVVSSPTRSSTSLVPACFAALTARAISAWVIRAGRRGI
jgi:hypothetical protein